MATVCPVLNRTQLNRQQRAAIEHPEGPLVVFAGAGSGKTMVITHRVAHLIKTRKVPPWRILAVTFTNKAAQEMRQRISSLLGESAHDLWVGTFHAICAKLLRNYSEMCGVPRDFVIYDDQDQQAVLKRLMRDLKLDDKRYVPKSLAWQINRAKQEGVSAQEFASNSAYEEVIRRVYIAYEENLQKAGALDFGDLIFRFVQAMENNEQLQQDLQGRYDHILVDEFQDTNRVQFRFVYLLSAAHQNICVVGDDDQSIYRWRGADRRNILDFNQNFAGATLIKLEQNYRSTKRILRVANAVITRNIDRESKTLWTKNQEGEPVTVLCCTDERDEARYFINRTNQLLQEGIQRSDIALLYRMHAQSRVFEEALRAANHPYRIVGGIRFYDRAEVKDVIAYLRVLSNPDDDVSLLRIINKPTRGIGKTSINRLLDAAARSGQSVWQTAQQAPSDPTFGTAAGKKISAFSDLMLSFRKKVIAGATITDISETLLAETGYLKNLQDQDSIEADVKLENLKELLGSIRQFEQSMNDATLSDFLELVTLQTDVDRMTDDDAITLMTIHAAKGLEFEVVSVAGMEEGTFPRINQDAIEDYEDELEEERRLAYVAFTRAQKNLTLSYTRQRFIYGETRTCRPSRFIDEISGQDIQRIGLSKDKSTIRPTYTKRNLEIPSPFPPAAVSKPKTKNKPVGDSYIDRSEGSDINTEVVFGMHVHHKKFGIGTVEKVSPGDPPTVIVKFRSCGKKTIKANYLSPV